MRTIISLWMLKRRNAAILMTGQRRWQYFRGEPAIKYPYLPCSSVMEISKSTKQQKNFHLPRRNTQAYYSETLSDKGENMPEVSRCPML
jgi:hypothetical protein